MAYLGKYIRQILSRQESVILPGFGSLVISQGAGASAGTGVIDPPGVLIKFDAEHPRDDGKLASEYALGERMDVEEARQQVLELIDAIKFKLDKGENYDLDLVGTFSRDDDNRIRFEKDRNWILDPDLFGLPSLDLLELEEEEAADGVKGKEAAEKDQTASVVEESTVVQKEAVPMKKKMANRAPVNKWRIIWIVVGALITVLVLILLIPTKNGDYGIEFSREGVVIKDNVVGEDLQDAEESNELVTGQDDDLNTQDQELEQDVEGTETGPETDSPVVSANNHFIIAGSFAELQNATDLMESLKTEGFPAEIIMTDKRLYRVSVKSYPERQQAIDDLSNIKAHAGLGGCWVWSR